ADAQETIARVADELEIRNVVARLAQLADDGDLDEYLSLFTEDAEWQMPGAPRRGHADILAGARERRSTGTAGPASNTRHVITTLAVRVDGTSTATSDSYFLFLADTNAAPTLRLIGQYHDTFVRRSDGWRLARREITFG